MASQPTFDLQIPGRASAMDHFASLGYDTWCVDMEGYGRSDKHRDINSDIANGADDLLAAADYIRKIRGVERLLVYGISSGALRAALFAQRNPARVARLALDAFVWTGKGSPTLAERRKRLPEYRARNRRRIDRAFIRGIFARDHPGTADPAVVDAFADAILALDDSVPTGTYVDMCESLPLVDPARVTVPTLIMRGEYAGSPRSRICSSSSAACRIPTSTSPSCRGSRTRASSRRTTSSRITSSRHSSGSLIRSTPAERTSLCAPNPRDPVARRARGMRRLDAAAGAGGESRHRGISRRGEHESPERHADTSDELERHAHREREPVAVTDAQPRIGADGRAESGTSAATTTDRGSHGDPDRRADARADTDTDATAHHEPSRGYPRTARGAAHRAGHHRDRDRRGDRRADPGRVRHTRTADQVRRDDGREREVHDSRGHQRAAVGPVLPAAGRGL